MPIQITAADSLPDREIKGLFDFMDANKLKEGLIITENNFDEQKSKNKKIKVIPLWLWLLKF